MSPSQHLCQSRQNGVEYTNYKCRIKFFLEHKVLVTRKHLKLHIYNQKLIFEALHTISQLTNFYQEF